MWDIILICDCDSALFMDFAGTVIEWSIFFFFFYTSKFFILL